MKRSIYRCICALLVILYACLSALPVYAGDTILRIDHKHTYNGMNQSFEQGYSPTVKDGRVQVTVPFLADEVLDQNEITVKVLFEKDEDSPFQQKNYQRTVRRQTYNSGQNSEAYVYQTGLPLIPDYKNGQYPIYLETNGRIADGQTFSQVFTIWILITDGQTEVMNTEAEQPVKTEEPDGMADADGYQGDGMTGGSDSGSEGGAADAVKHQARIILDSYEIENGMVQAGEAFSVSLTFRNTNQKSALYNGKIKVECEAADIAFDKNSFYVEKTASQETFAVVLTGTVAKDCEIKNARITFSMDYEDKDGEALLDTESMVLGIRQPVSARMGQLQIPDIVYTAETIPVAVQIMNLSRTQLYNVRVEVEAPGLQPVGTLFVGNMEPGSAEEGQVNLFIGTMEAESEKYGESRGTYTLVYEDEYGEEYRETEEFATVIKEPEVLVSSFKEEPPKTESQWWISILIIVILLGGVTAVPLTRTILRNRGMSHEVD